MLLQNLKQPFGNVFNFVMNYEHLSFPETVSLLAKNVGITLDIYLKKEDNKCKNF